MVSSLNEHLLTNRWWILLGLSSWRRQELNVSLHIVIGFRDTAGRGQA